MAVIAVYARSSLIHALRNKDTNPEGWATVWGDLGNIVRDARDTLPAWVSGVCIQRASGALADFTARTIGEGGDGKLKTGMSVGSFDDRLPTDYDLEQLEELVRLRDFVRFYTGFPLLSASVRYLVRFPVDGVRVTLDMAGGAMATGGILAAYSAAGIRGEALARRFAIEPYPVPELRCPWFSPEIPSLTMRRYMGLLRDRDAMPEPDGLRHGVAFNNAADGVNKYDPAEAITYEKMGYAVEIPRDKIEQYGGIRRAAGLK